MTRQELLERIEPIYSRIQNCADEIASLTTAPAFDEDYKVERNGDLSVANLDRLHVASVELSLATDALLGYGDDSRSNEEVADTVTRSLLGLEPDAERGIAGDRCEVGNECGRAGCKECQQ